MPDYPEDRKLAPGPPKSLDEKWYKWAGAPIGISYTEADRMVSEAVERLERERDLLLYTLQQIKELSFARDAHRALQEVREITIDTLKEG